MRMLACLGLLLAGCSSLNGIEKLIPASAVMEPCNNCYPGTECTPCCSDCVGYLCYGYCQDYPEYCEDCHDFEYWDCIQRHCTHQK